MHLGITGPVTITPFQDLLPPGTVAPPPCSFPLIGKLVRALLERGHRVTVFAGSTEIGEVWQTQGENISLIIVPFRKRRAPYDFYRAERTNLVAAMRSTPCDLIHAHWTYEFAAAALDSGKPCLVTAHDSPSAILRYFICTRYLPFWTAKALLGAYVVRKADHLTTVSPYCRDALQKALRPRAPITVVPNGIDAALIEAGTRRLAKGLPDGPFTVTSVLEGFQHRKNPKNALKAFALLRQRIPTARFLMFGTGYETGGEANRWATGEHLSGGVEFAGKVGHHVLFERLENEAHVLLHPAREESFGMAPLEAMSLGIPVAGGHRSGGVPFVLDGGKAGLLVNVESPEEIAGGLGRIAGDKAFCQELATAGHRRAAGVFPLEKMVDAYEAEYRRILNIR